MTDSLEGLQPGPGAGLSPKPPEPHWQAPLRLAGPGPGLATQAAQAEAASGPSLRGPAAAPPTRDLVSRLTPGATVTDLSRDGISMDCDGRRRSGGRSLLTCRSGAIGSATVSFLELEISRVDGPG